MAQKNTHRPNDTQVEYIQGILDGRFLWVIWWRPNESRAVIAAFFGHLCVYSMALDFWNMTGGVVKVLSEPEPDDIHQG